MDPKKTTPLVLVAALAGVGVGRATVPSPPAPKVDQVCAFPDGSGFINTSADGKNDQLLIPSNHELAIMHRSGGKALDAVPPRFSKQLKGLLDEARKLAAASNQNK